MKINIAKNDIPLTDLHMHTIYSDGCDSPADMLKSAAAKGLKIIGISDHSYTFFDESYCIQRDRFDEYLSVVFSLKEKCSALKENPRFAKALGSSDIRFYAGIEQDYYSTFPSDAFDYVTYRLMSQPISLNARVNRSMAGISTALSKTTF